ncbi:MAG TPA: adenylate/guanylate cyclase domain-containing response regulator [Cyanobacteria bacterium UBA11369]|nr:adenylate/guanylate cyclase domain-containing response regulator [Cyanobacteria bacterium UBA11371]HBE34468.1 adenylate/guanylate cyclase domain-containing response regulator [Cyanobacteria bacterium UBA11368]HBE52388.1 adenylate/guanylate cyclase domain-containing response regulator [Cyanobacteria bacterium UBA11369]
MQDNPPRILLVDDEPDNLYLLQELLKSQGYITLTAASGSEALAIASNELPDMILLDVMMPGLDGFEVCQQLRMDTRLQTVPVIFLTALRDDTSRMRGLELMGDDYLTKPINHKLLLTKMASLLRLQQMRSQKVQQQINQQINEQSKPQLSAAGNINQILAEKLRLFVPEQLLQRIAPKGLESIQLGNVKEEELTVLFCDIRGFTGISESQSAGETFKWLNGFFSRMNACINANNGFIDKFLGDALMAIFDREGHAQDALSAAVMMQQSVKEFNSNLVDYKLTQPIKIGIGIDTGIAAIGALGAEGRLDSTAIGDVVNTAARLQELTKDYGCGIIVSKATIARLDRPELFYLRSLGCVVPRGKQQGQELYEVQSIAATRAIAEPIIEPGVQAWHAGTV